MDNNPNCVPYYAPSDPGTAARFCPQCGNAIASGENFCQRCGHPAPVPQPAVPQAPAVQTAPAKKGNVVKIVLCLVLCIAALALFVSGMGQLNSDEYEFYTEHLATCKRNQSEARSLMYQSSGFFRSAYQDIVDSYEEMIEDDEDALQEIRTKATVMFVGAALCAVAAVVVILIPKKPQVVPAPYPAYPV